MNPEGRARAGQAVAARMTELELTQAAVARAAEIDIKTIRSLLRGDHWPSWPTRERIELVLGWPAGEIARHGWGIESSLDRFSTVDLIREVLRRLEPSHP